MQIGAGRRHLFANASAFLEAVRRRRPDLLIAGLRMPGRSGLDLLGDVSAARLPVCVIF
jgi:FixJ family two-component response regulator